VWQPSSFVCHTDLIDHFMHECTTGFIKGIVWGGALFCMLVNYVWSPIGLLSLALLPCGVTLAHKSIRTG
jgi:hypothetical protein